PDGRDRNAHEVGRGRLQASQVDRWRAGRPVFEQNIGAGREFEELAAPLVSFEVECDDALAAVVKGRLDGDTGRAEEGRFAVELVARWGHDANDVSSAVGEKTAGEYRIPAGTFEHTETCEGRRIGHASILTGSLSGGNRFRVGRFSRRLGS